MYAVSYLRSRVSTEKLESNFEPRSEARINGRHLILVSHMSERCRAGQFYNFYSEADPGFPAEPSVCPLCL